MFSYAFCIISKNTFFTEHLRTTASGVFFREQKLISDIAGEIHKHVTNQIHLSRSLTCQILKFKGYLKL